MNDRVMKYFIYTVIGIVTAAIIAGFFIVGSPKEERLRRFDQQRVEHLQFIQSEVLNYWMNKNQLPGQLSSLEDNIRGIRIPNDPETGAPYIYEIENSLTFSLCATFARPSLESEIISGKPRPIEPYPYGYGIQQNWQHDVGYTCFERTIDKDFYKPVKF